MQSERLRGSLQACVQRVTVGTASLPLFDGDLSSGVQSGCPGNLCNPETSFTFIGSDAFLEFAFPSPGQTTPTLQLSLAFQTSQSEGLLVYVGEDASFADFDFVVLAMQGGRVQLAYSNLGGLPGFTFHLTSSGLYNDTVRHTVNVTLGSGSLELVVDDTDRQSLSSKLLLFCL